MMTTQTLILTCFGITLVTIIIVLITCEHAIRKDPEIISRMFMEKQQEKRNRRNRRSRPFDL
jgi:hypothetical protein